MILAHLDGKPIKSGDRLFGLDGTEFVVVENYTRHKEYPFIARTVPKFVGQRTGRDWITDTHYEGDQILFWEKRTKEQIAEFNMIEQAEEMDVEFEAHRRWLASLTDPDAYMRE